MVRDCALVTFSVEAYVWVACSKAATTDLHSLTVSVKGAFLKTNLQLQLSSHGSKEACCWVTLSCQRTLLGCWLFYGNVCHLGLLAAVCRTTVVLGSWSQVGHSIHHGSVDYWQDAVFITVSWAVRSLSLWFTRLVDLTDGQLCLAGGNFALKSVKDLRFMDCCVQVKRFSCDVLYPHHAFILLPP